MANSRKQLYEFGPFRIDTEERLLLRDGDVVPLPPKASDTLLLLVRNSGRALDKDVLMKELWPDTFVEEANLAQHISLLRKVFGESRTEPQYIETIPRRGYRFLATVNEIQAIPDPAASVSRRPEARQHPILRRLLPAVVIFACGFFASLMLFPGSPAESSPYRFTPLVVDPSLKAFPLWSPSGRTVAYSGQVDGI